MRVLVTGEAGFVGGSFTAKLLGVGDEVTICSRSRADTPGIFMSARPNLARRWIEKAVIPPYDICRLVSTMAEAGKQPTKLKIG